MAKTPQVTSAHSSFVPPLSPPRKSSRLTTRKNDTDEDSHELQLSYPSKFMNNVITDDLLIEILIRIQNPKSLIQYSTVSKRWFSLMSNPQFISNFIHHHHLKSLPNHENHSQPHTILLQIKIAGNEFNNFYQIFSRASKILHQIPSSSCFLNFLPPGPGPNKVRASFNDLLLVSPSHFQSRIFYICNPLTRQWLALPEPASPTRDYHRCGLIFEPSSCDKQLGCVNNLKYRLKVVLVNFFKYYPKEGEYHYSFETFCSETGKWSESVVSLSRPMTNRWGDLIATNVVTCNGILHWLSGDMVPDFLIAFDPFHDEKHWHLINLPAEIESRSWQSYLDNWCLGVCRGRLRISRLFKYRNTSFKLKVWELIGDYKTASPWCLVHKISIDRMQMVNMTVLAFHPNDDNVVFLLCDNYHVKKYNILKSEFERVGEFQGGKSVLTDLSAFSLVHPPWPTPIPPLQ